MYKHPARQTPLLSSVRPRSFADASTDSATFSPISHIKKFNNLGGEKRQTQFLTITERPLKMGAVVRLQPIFTF